MNTKDWLRIALRPDICRRSVKIALVVGSVLVLINYGDSFLDGNISVRELVKIGMTFCVPFCVATDSSVCAVKATQMTSDKS